MKPFVRVFLLLSLLIGTALHAENGPVVYVAGDGSGDFNTDGLHDQVEINQALDLVAANPRLTTVYLKGPMIYHIDDMIAISANTILEGDADAVIRLVDNARWRPRFKPMIGQKGHSLEFGLRDASITTGNITIRGFEIDGNRENQREPSGQSHYNIISLQNAYNVTVNDMYLHDNLADALQIGHTFPGRVINLRFFNNRVHRTGHDGVYVTNGYGIEIHDNVFTENRTDAHIRVQDADQIRIYNNIAGNSVNRRFSGGIGVSLQVKGNTPLHDAEIYNNYFYGRGDFHGIWLWQTAPGGDLNTHRDVYIHDNVISWFKNDAIRIEGFHNTRIERNVIESDAGEGGGQGNGVVFTRGKTSPEITGYRTILRDNIIQNNPRFGIDNQMPGSHTFVSTGNTLFGNLAGPYNNVASHDDSFAEPPISDVLQRVYYDVLSPAWKHALATQDFRGDMNARQAWALYQR